MRNRFKGLDLIDTVPEELWTEVGNIIQEVVTKTIPKKKKSSRAKTNRVLPREHTGHSKHPLPTTQEMTLHMDIIRWSIPNQFDYSLCN